ncbi:M20 family metallopeptidase [Clostridioides mangenotii]|uniref:M20 metallopeptidase family protein n=1 Tax=Metaclostridioides mangenotii TaxID=1540 RepID=UPI002149D34A|nr:MULTISPECIES: M20 family metallopeptidase [Clostridioides]MCR1953357.1 M20 family metallopeptidase [Clostridioides mangenotii]
MKKEILKYMNEIQNKLVDIRRELHSIPELSMQEYLTCNTIKKYLNSIDGIEVISIEGQTGLVGILQGEKKGSGKCVMLRADMDALPITESNDCEYRSLTEGMMHACGHDAHMTWLLGSAMILSKLKERFSGTVKFVFQPAEETGAGAKLMISNGVLECPYVDTVIGAHCFPEYQAGKIIIPTKTAFSATRPFSIIVEGKGGHGSWPDKCIDPIAVSTQIYNGLQQIVSRKLNPMEPAVLTIGSIHAGPIDKGNIIPNTCTMKGTLRHITKEGLESMINNVDSMVYNIAKANGAMANVVWSNGVNHVINDKECTEIIYNSTVQLLDRENVEYSHESYLGGEDFCFYSEERRSAYFFVGCVPLENVGKVSLHSCDFCICENILSKVSGIFAMTAVNILNGNKYPF